MPFRDQAQWSPGTVNWIVALPMFSMNLPSLGERDHNNVVKWVLFASLYRQGVLRPCVKIYKYLKIKPNYCDKHTFWVLTVQK